MGCTVYLVGVGSSYAGIALHVRLLIKVATGAGIYAVALQYFDPPTYSELLRYVRRPSLAL
jgi:hypothetical protein